MEPPKRTNAPERNVVLYDGDCRLCTAGAQKLCRLAAAGAIELVDFQRPGALTPFPGLTHELCMQQMFLVAPNGRVYAGAEAITRALMTRPIIGWLARIYFVPGFRWLMDLIYRLIARHRYRIMGKRAASECDGGTCANHFPGSDNTQPRDYAGRYAASGGDEP